ncbi:MAG TPA: hypothetical protein VL749_01050 [Patescibacteria group bacterium]|nr:hypothetical protein [Patescibacteria group bacterium]
MHHSIPAEHAQHDLDLIAGHAAGDLTDTERKRADDLVRSCTSCADLRRDLLAIAAATRTLPAPASPRDFRLTPTQAARLRRGGWRKSLLRPFAAPRSAVRPMAMAFTSLGLAGLFVANILPSLFGGMAASAPAPAALQPAASAAAAGSAAPGATTGSEAQFGPAGQATPVPVAAGSGGGKSNDLASTVPDVAGGPYAQQPSAAAPAYRDQPSTGRDSEQLQSRAPEPSPIVIGSLVLLALGLALFGLRFLARRAA